MNKMNYKDILSNKSNQKCICVGILLTVLTIIINCIKTKCFPSIICIGTVILLVLGFLWYCCCEKRFTNQTQKDKTAKQSIIILLPITLLNIISFFLFHKEVLLSPSSRLILALFYLLLIFINSIKLYSIKQEHSNLLLPMICIAIAGIVINFANVHYHVYMAYEQHNFTTHYKEQATEDTSGDYLEPSDMILFSMDCLLDSDISGVEITNELDYNKASEDNISSKYIEDFPTAKNLIVGCKIMAQLEKIIFILYISIIIMGDFSKNPAKETE